VESGEEIRYRIEETVVRLLDRSICNLDPTSHHQCNANCQGVAIHDAQRWTYSSNTQQDTGITDTRSRAWLLLATILKRSILPSYPTPPLRPSHSPA
jgi:hypothetical protein